MSKKEKNNNVHKVKNHVLQTQKRKRLFSILFSLLFIALPAVILWFLGTSDAGEILIPFYGLSIALPLWVLLVAGVWFLMFKLDLLESRSIAFLIPVTISLAGIIWSYPLPIWARALIALGCVISTLVFLYISSLIEDKKFQKSLDDFKSGKIE